MEEIIEARLIPHSIKGLVSVLKKEHTLLYRMVSAEYDLPEDLKKGKQKLSAYCNQECETLSDKLALGFGLYLLEDYNKSISILEKIEYPFSYYILARIYQEKREIGLSEKYYKLSMKGGYSFAFYHYAELLEHQGKSISEYLCFYEESMKKKNVFGSYALGEYYMSINDPKFIDCFQVGVTKQHIPSIMKLGDIYFKGNGKIKKDFKKALEYYRIASDLGDSTARYYIGSCYEYGYGVDINLDKAISYYMKASTGNSDALNALALCYEFDYINYTPYEDIFNLYSSSGLQGNKDGLCNMGFCFMMGIGTQRDKKKAMECFSLAAYSQSALAYFYLGICQYKNPKYSRQARKASKKEAERLFKKAQELGCEEAEIYFKEPKLQWCFLNSFFRRREVYILASELIKHEYYETGFYYLNRICYHLKNQGRRGNVGKTQALKLYIDHGEYDRANYLLKYLASTRIPDYVIYPIMEDLKKNGNITLSFYLSIMLERKNQESEDIDSPLDTLW